MPSALSASWLSAVRVCATTRASGKRAAHACSTRLPSSPGPTTKMSLRRVSPSYSPSP